MALPNRIRPSYVVDSMVNSSSLNCSLNSTSPLEFDLILLMLNRLPFSSVNMSVKSQSRRGEILAILINSWLSANELGLTPATSLSTNGSS